ncbi:HlyD family efflux transporter periplasmic adaptor subunit [Gilvimarinus sp. SDUM040013]|uniref:HlyD family efflux transporter periplasmic adaptor subunit n=1 Tax=Gilvimarinus gilvus TaxID=3058038 RepID=A0ABU4S1N2_9GAMM|nr:HlyD family efflux transporter periplasmic adaptor subunit [Gilvimarinus sp. SDUM040013]MDO3384436.1 HlyD family efflux transporter periplasmic adaptor subunit [Gilvimarinus sp. SDUM040013]MDX6851095.1 HlyD family efflux transporter periplasmic adaptor subunit [Gilvimarinus sp. SDUM040013]
MRYLVTSLLLSLCVVTANAETLMLSGEVAAENSQVFVAPEAESWMVQIAWMIEEGEKVKEGDPVVQYDTASIAASLEQLEASLRKVEAESRRNDLVQDLSLLEAKNTLQVADLMLQKAQLDANIPRELLSQLQYEQYQLALTRAQNAKQEAEKALQVKQQDVAAEKQRNQVEIAGAENELERVQVMLDSMTQHADRAGTAMYVEHPWTRQKVREGDSVQRGFSVLEIPSTDQLQVKAWLNEVDVARLHEGQRVSIAFDARPGVSLGGVVERIGRQAEPKQHWGDSAYLNVDIQFSDPLQVDLLPGMSVRIAVEGVQ